MIIAMLFLILFALLFPGALRFLFALIFIGSIIALGEAHANPVISYWHQLDEQCRGSSGDKANQACDKRLAVDEVLKEQGCKFHYPSGWPELNGEYWKCPQSARTHIMPRQHFEYYTPGQMYSGPLGAHIGPGPHVMEPYTGW